MAAAASEREGYSRSDTAFKYLRDVSPTLGDTGHCTIHAVRTPSGGLISDPDAGLQAFLDSFQAKHGDALPKPDPHTRSTIHNDIPKVFNRQQGRAIEDTPLIIEERQRALDRLKKGVMPGIHRLLADACQRLTLPIKGSQAAYLWDILTGTALIAPKFANLVDLLYEKGEWAQPGNWRIVVWATPRLSWCGR